MSSTNGCSGSAVGAAMTIGFVESRPCAPPNGATMRPRPCTIAIASMPARAACSPKVPIRPVCETSCATASPTPEARAFAIASSIASRPTTWP